MENAVRITPELSLLLLCARPRSLAPERGLLTDAAGRVADWDLFLRLAGRHGLVPLVAQCNRERGFLPALPGRRLAAALRSNAARSLAHGTELLRILQGLAAQGVPALPFKGPVMAQELHGDLSLRPFSDLDILVPVEHLGTAVAVMQNLDYLPYLPTDSGGGRHSLRARHHIWFRHRTAPVFVEIHWRLVRERLGLKLPTARVLAAARPTAFLGAEVLAMEAVDLFIYLAVRAANDSWDRLEHLRCLAEIVTQEPRIDGQTVLRRAREEGALRRVHVVVLLLAEVLGVSFDETVLREARDDAAAARIAAAARRRWVEAEPSAGRRAESAYHRVLCLDGWRDRVRFALSWALEPNEVDWSAVRLPSRLRPLYYVVRPFRLLAGAGAKVLSRPAGRRAGRRAAPERRPGRQDTPPD